MLTRSECARTRRLLWELAQDTLTTTERERVEAHLRGCARCAQEAADYRKSVAYLAEFQRVPVPAAEAPWEAIAAQLTAPARRRLPVAAAFAVAVAAACAAVALLPHPRQRTATQPVPPRVTVPGAQPVPPGRTVGMTIPRGQPSSPKRWVAAEPRRPEPGAVAPRRETLRHETVRHETVRHETVRRETVRRDAVRRDPVRTAAVPTPKDDLDTLNASLDEVLQRWAPAGAAEAVRAAAVPAGKTDEFIYVEPPRLASTDPASVRAALLQQEREKAIVDPRLEERVNLAVKGLAFTDLCHRLSEQTGVTLRAARTTADEKVTLFCEKQPLREVMRQISRVFGFKWGRAGEEGAYRYELFQDLRGQLAEEELRNRDLNEALLGVDEAMGAYKPLLGLSREQLRERLRALPEKDRSKELLRNAVGSSFSGIQAYMYLGPAEIQALRAGNEVKFSTEDALPQEFPAGWAQRLLDSFQGISLPSGPLQADKAWVSLSLDHSELGEMALYCAAVAGGIGVQNKLAVGRSPSSASPDNRAANPALQQDPAFRARVTFEPRACQLASFRKAFDLDFSQGRHIEDDLQDGVQPPFPHLSSADVWEEVHARTGLPIVADYYTHLFPAGRFSIVDCPLFDALCESADALGVRWQKDGDFLQCRSTDFFWNKLKEVPNRWLDRWQRDREMRGGLPIEDLLEMALLSDRQLDSLLVGQGVKHCRGLMDWGILASPEYRGPRRKLDPVRPLARFLAALPPSLRQQALSPAGLPLAALTPQQFEALEPICHIRVFGREVEATPQNGRLRVDYVPTGTYVWRAVYDSKEEYEAHRGRSPICVGRTPEAALAAARQVYPKARAEEIHKSYGTLATGLLGPKGYRSLFGGARESYRIDR